MTIEAVIKHMYIESAIENALTVSINKRKR